MTGRAGPVAAGVVLVGLGWFISVVPSSYGTPISVVPSLPAPPMSEEEARYRDLAQGRFEDADAAFRESLAREPQQIASLLGRRSWRNDRGESAKRNSI
ncbi:MAG: hypothetical protein KF693_14170 [Nitrospira sp.]|nr:hypothetical protein [Nitrospira sp.]